MKYKPLDKVRIKSLDWYNENKDEYGVVSCGEQNFVKGMKKFCSKTLTISEDAGDGFLMLEDYNGYVWTDEMIEGLVEEETPKFKVNDIVFVKNIGWVRITNSYWYSLANEYIYEAIGLNGEGEYDCISQSNIECQMLPESENPHTGGNKITLDEYKNNDKEWLFNKLAMLDNITALESIQDIFNHLQQSKYPKTYEECCKVLGKYADVTYGYKKYVLHTLQMLLVCRDAYWKIAGEEMGLEKPWEPDWKDDTIHKFIIHAIKDKIHCGVSLVKNHLLAFPTAEMRDAFYENFKKLIESCKELL